MLDEKASHIHLKLKYHNVNDEVTIVNIDLSREKKIYKVLKKYHKEG